MRTCLPPRERSGVASRARGIVLLALLLILALGGIGLMAAVDVWSVTRQREREQELLFVGDQYRQAIQRYYFAAPSGSPRVLPGSLEALLEDDRYPMPIHHLRRLYTDPISGKPEWGLVRTGEQISGVYSLSESKPLKRAGFVPAYQQFSGKESYRDWVFAFAPPANSGTVAPVPTSPPPSRSPPAPPSNPNRRNPA